MLAGLCPTTLAFLLAFHSCLPTHGFIKSRCTYTPSSLGFGGTFTAYRSPRSTHLESHNVVNSELLGVLNERSPKSGDNVPRLLSRYGLVSKLSSGLYTFLPLGTRILERIKRMIRTEMCKLDAVELSLPILQPRSLLEGNLEAFGSELFRLKDRDRQDYFLSPTCEDLACAVVKAENFPLSKASLPITVYQINTKFRDEVRVSELLSRTKEFLMFDAYSFHASEDCANFTYTLFLESFKNMLNLMGLRFRQVELNEDNVSSHELRVELAPESTPDPESEGDAQPRDIEVAHLFKFGASYSEKHDLKYETTDRAKESTHMNSYGIGLNRLVNALVNVYSDEDGLKLPQVVAPYDVAIIPCSEQCDELASRLKRGLAKKGLSVLLDDRDYAIKDKMRDSKLIGIPHTILLSDRFQRKNTRGVGKALWDEIAKNSKISNYYNLGQAAENVLCRKDSVNLAEYADTVVEYHPRLVGDFFVIKLRDFFNLLNVS